MLHIASRFIRNKQDLIQIYKTFIRSKLEYSCTVWHSSLTKTNESDIERVQKAAVKLILKEKYDGYENSLRLLNLDSLYERREKLCLSFAKRCLKMENLKKLFPKRKVKHDMKTRKSEKYFVKNINTERYRISSIPAMQRMLNKEDLKMRSLVKSIDGNSNFVTREYCFLNPISVKI